jgi:hypothetical protein
VTKVVVLLIGLAMFALLAGLLWYLANRFERAGERRPDSLWRAGELDGEDGLHVVIERVTSGPTRGGTGGGTGAGIGGTGGPAEVLESRELGVVPADDPDRAARLEDLRTLARDRARLLNDQARHA